MSTYWFSEKVGKLEYINFRFLWTICTTFLSFSSPYTQAYAHTQNSNFKAMKKGKFQVGTVLITNTKRKLVLESGRVEEALNFFFFFFEALHFVLLFEAKHLR